MLAGVTGCQTAPEPMVVEKVIERRLEVPDYLLECAGRPKQGQWESQRDARKLITAAFAAGDDCRSKLGKVGILVKGQTENPGL